MLDKFLDRYLQSEDRIAQVGAHFGQELKILKNYKFKSLYLFEPNPIATKNLQTHIKLNRKIKLYPFALGNINSKEIFYISNQNEGQSSSLLKPKLHLKVQPNISFSSQLVIDVKRYEDLNIENVNFLILDVQGYELEVLRGFGKKLQFVDYIFTEINRKHLYEGNALIYDLDKYLQKNGLIRIWTSWRRADMPWGDAFYIKINKVGRIKSILYLVKNFLLTNRIIFFLFYFFDFQFLIFKIRQIQRS